MLFGVIICAALILLIALFAALFQSSAAEGEAVNDEIKREKVLECLPGDNCGACGYESCADLALAIVHGDVSTGSCPAGGAAAAQAIGLLMGEESSDGNRLRAQVMCSGDGSCTRKKYVYEGGADDCVAAMKLGGGDKSCKFSCIGLGNCKAVCPFGAIEIVDGSARVDHRKCKGCGICVSACPKHLIKLIPYDTYYWVGCMSKEGRAGTLKGCDTGCIGCEKCVQACPESAVSVVHNCAEIDYTKCSGCGMCYQICPQGIIWKADTYGADGLDIVKGNRR